jgi:uncharacterized protein
MNATVFNAAELRTLLKEFKEQHGAEFHLSALGYFGSYARGEATPESDVDVVFHTDRPDLFLTAMLKQDLEAVLHCSVDVVRLRDTMNPRLKARIEREAKYV